LNLSLEELKELNKQSYARLADCMPQDEMVSKKELPGLIQSAVYAMFSEMVLRNRRSTPNLQ
jgi:hypothetical protein